MNAVHYLRDEIAVVGWACRLPGARSVGELWSLLLEGRCAVTSVPPDRFPLDRYSHPRRSERGKSYSFAAGIIDNPFGFDPSVFGVSPREAVQMDPQQRVLLQMTWEALEDAGIRPSSIAGTEVGVFVGASHTDYGHGFFADRALADSQFATGTALAVLSNRISYAFDLHGPSVTIDTACSSSLVALHQAVEALHSGRIDTAIVAGINLITSPASFIAFSQASMLSPTGLCRAFSAEADGFVRGEGGAVLVLRKATQAQAARHPVHGLILATDVNSDGRTHGISLPSPQAQESLLERVYARSGIEPDRLAFVEAHGTGTPAGDPIEAQALGRSLGMHRSNPLPIGSIKTNIGHLEPASGMAGLLKALLALNHGILPRSLHCDRPNPNIDFESLGLGVCTDPLLLPGGADRCAGVNSFGFGGTNAHAIVAPGRKAPAVAFDDAPRRRFFALSAQTRPALAALASNYAARVASLPDREAMAVAAGVAHRRENLPERLVVAAGDSRNVSAALSAFAAGADHPLLTAGSVATDASPVAFVYSGNGSQWVGMGRTAYRRNADFRARLDDIDGYFQPLAGWSLAEMLFSETLAKQVALTSVAQPLIFAIQSAATEALRVGGLKPAAVLGHSVGEVAAAEAVGILDLRTAVRVIHCRSTRQELTRDAGAMAAVIAPAETIEPLAKAVGATIAAINSPRAVTVAGPRDALVRLRALADERRIPYVPLDLDYPFHTDLMASVEEPLLADLKGIQPERSLIPFVSTVSGAVMPGTRLDGGYWWRNVREPVRFGDAIRSAAQLGARCFVEIGPRPTLLKHIGDSLDGVVAHSSVIATLDRGESATDPFDAVLARALVSGAQVDLPTLFGEDPGPGVTLACYPWQVETFRFAPTPEAIGTSAATQPLLGVRLTSDALEWRSHVDTSLYPEFADHNVGGRVLFPGAAFLEMALAVASEWLKTEQVTVSHLEILKPLDLTDGKTVELMTRVSPGSDTFEIASRPRLSEGAWLSHCRGKIGRANPADAEASPAVPRGGRPVESEAIYGWADGSGLNYGPAFRLVTAARLHGERRVSVSLAPQAASTPYLLDPMRLDASVHSMMTQFPALRAQERGVAYVPVRVDEVALYKPHGVPAHAVMEILNRSERSIYANFHIYDADHALIAVLGGARCQAMPVRRARSLERTALVERTVLIPSLAGETGVEATVADVLAAAEASGRIRMAGDEFDEATLLLEGWATAMAMEIVLALETDGRVVVDRLEAEGRLSDDLRPWLVNLLIQLEAAGLAAADEPGAWRLSSDPSLPSSVTVLNAISTEQPARASALLLAAAVTGLARRLAATGSLDAAAIAPSAFDFHGVADSAVTGYGDALADLIETAHGLWPRGRALRVLQIGVAPLMRTLGQRSDVVLTVFEPDQRRFERAQAGLSREQPIVLLGPDAVERLGAYDLIVAAGGLHRLPVGFGLPNLSERLAPGGLLIGIEPRPSLFQDLVFGLDASWFAYGLGDEPVGPLMAGGEWLAALSRAGFKDTRAQEVRCGSDRAVLIVANTGSTTGERAGGVAKTALVVGAPAFAAALEGEGLAVTAAGPDFVIPDASHPDMVVLTPPLRERDDPVAALTDRCLAIRRCADRLPDERVPLWLVFHGARSGSGPADPVESGAWAFSRVLANESPRLDVRRLDVATGLDPGIAGRRIREIVLSGTAETELQIDPAGTIRALRVEPLEANEAHDAPPAPVARLVRGTDAGRRVVWQADGRPELARDAVEIAVEATGMNFRDLMWTLGLLPDDMLEDGYTGPTLGLECAGRILRVGDGVKTLKPGDRVVALAASAFSTHVAVPAQRAAKIGDDLSFEAAATIPVAFLTAHYGLATLARLRRGEWVLIHGGAGGVGMAAIQIAMARGARIIATAGSQAKRDLLHALGVSHVLDSRAPRLAVAVRQITGDGVDVVLNSLAGEAMEDSIACLKPFGRFIELGKRDYVSNTHVGLRPFRKNLSYFGLDVDQLIGRKSALGRRVFAQVMRAFEDGTYTPLPHSVFAADDASEALALMQQAAHIGKIVVRPPRPEHIPALPASFTVSAAGTHIVTGGFGGFGLETARWLVDRGARHLVMLGRSGPASDAAREALADFARRGVSVVAEACDIADTLQVEALFARIAATMPPIAGVMHAAMVLDDALLSNLDEERFAQVLAPKVKGADILDRLTRDLALDYFVLFSSVTTAMGNPGQGNYVAANAYMDALARRRRAQGRPALSVGWGPISDVGVVARDERLSANLRKLSGVAGLKAREALDLMAQALARASLAPGDAAVIIAPHEAAFAADRLPVLRSPTYAALTRSDARTESGASTIDVRALLRSEGTDAARIKIGDVIATQLARVLHARESDISRIRPLADIGLDSLMALELGGNLEAAFGAPVTLSGSAGTLTVTAIADAIIAGTGFGQDRAGVLVDRLAERHLDAAPVAGLSAMREAVADDERRRGSNRP